MSVRARVTHAANIASSTTASWNVVFFRNMSDVTAIANLRAMMSRIQ